MIIEEVRPTENCIDEYDGKLFFAIKVNGKEEFFVRDCEPEDSNLSGGFNDCYGIVKLMKLAYEAGKLGEEFKVLQALQDHF